MALIARALAKGGFGAVAPDLPAHSSAESLPSPRSNMFQYCRAISAVAKSLDPLFAIVGHSFGAMCGAFVVAGLQAFSDCRISTDRLALVSAPPTLKSVLENFCRHDASGASEFPELKERLEAAFDFRADDYAIEAAVQGIPAPVLLAHDDADEEFPVREIVSIHEAVPGTELFLTHGSGHQRILGNRALIERLKVFLA
jgi:pimeloyl-ACP methyl ester carboxylesterase